MLVLGVVPIQVIVEVLLGFSPGVLLELLAVERDEVAPEFDLPRSRPHVVALLHATRLVAKAVAENVLEVGEVVLDQPLDVPVLEVGVLQQQLPELGLVDRDDRHRVTGALLIRHLRLTLFLRLTLNRIAVLLLFRSIHYIQELLQNWDFWSVLLRVVRLRLFALNFLYVGLIELLLINGFGRLVEMVLDVLSQNRLEHLRVALLEKLSLSVLHVQLALAVPLERKVIPENHCYY